MPKNPFAPAEGFDKRLRSALTARGYAVTIRRFTELMEEKNEELDRQTNGKASVPCSYPTIMLYLKGRRTPSTEDFSKVAANVLGVRWQWLHRNEEPMTKTVEVMTTLTAVARPTAFSDDQTGPQATIRHIARIASPLATTPAALSMFTEVWDRYVRSSPVEPDFQQQFILAERLWKQITAPLFLLSLEPKDTPLFYYIGILNTLMPLIPGPGKGTDLSRPPRKNAAQSKGSKRSRSSMTAVNTTAASHVRVGNLVTLSGGDDDDNA